MPFRLIRTDEAEADLAALDTCAPKKARKARRKLAFLELDPHHPSLETHQYDGECGANGEQLYEAYVETNTPNALRILWHYGPAQGFITVMAIIGHPQ